jgi:hypothetical protein
MMLARGPCRRSAGGFHLFAAIEAPDFLSAPVELNERGRLLMRRAAARPGNQIAAGNTRAGPPAAA